MSLYLIFGVGGAFLLAVCALVAWAMLDSNFFNDAPVVMHARRLRQRYADGVPVSPEASSQTRNEQESVRG
jgi:hypothetical protein